MGLLSKAAVKAGDTEYEVREYHKTHPSFQCLVLEFPWEEKLSRMTANFGVAFPLSPENSLVLIPGGMDRELLAHRLSKSLPARILNQFQAADPGEALELLAPYR
ncbi:MAG: hypothetical protein LBK27_06100 [Treponema sp.]|jgi:hypothetical protein|nr:hypothetical protein [Treponema sp.]